jgi:hypothetical protein
MLTLCSLMFLTQSDSESGLLQMVAAAASLPTRPAVRSSQSQLNKLERSLSVEEIAQFRCAPGRVRASVYFEDGCICFAK